MNKVDPNWRSNGTNKVWASKLGIPASTFGNLIKGHNRYSEQMKALLARMAKGNGSVEQSIVDEADDSIEPGWPTPETERFHVAANPTGGWNVIEKEWVVHHVVLAQTTTEDKAKRIVDLLNKEAG
ncbi:MAG: hypothetical protein ACR2RF_14375 [Geminicoccaceae bacterium]